jgi:hypothetical protein
MRKKGCFVGRPGKGKIEKDQLKLTIGNKMTEFKRGRNGQVKTVN